MYSNVRGNIKLDFLTALESITLKFSHQGSQDVGVVH